LRLPFVIDRPRKETALDQREAYKFTHPAWLNKNNSVLECAHSGPGEWSNLDPALVPGSLQITCCPGKSKLGRLCALHESMQNRVFKEQSMALWNWFKRVTPRGCLPTRRLRLERLELRCQLAGFVAVGSDIGVPSEVRIYADRDNNDTFETLVQGTQPTAIFSPFGSFTGGVRVALGDFDGDFNDELVCAAGPGGGPHVIIYDLNPDGTVGGIVDSFFALDAAFTGGLFVAAGNLNGLPGNDLRDELVIGADAGGGPHVRIFSDTDGDGLVSDDLTDEFFAFGLFTGGVRVAVANTNDISGDEVICAAGPGGGPHVVVFTDSDGDRAVTDQPIWEQAFVYAPNFTGGVYVAAADLDAVGLGASELIVGAGAGGGPHVKIFGDANDNDRLFDDPLFDEFFGYSPTFTGGVRVAAGNTDLEGNAEVLTGAGPGGGPHVKIFDDNGDPGSLFSDNALDDEFFAFPGAYSAGVFVAFGTVSSGTDSFPGAPVQLLDNMLNTVEFSIPAGAGLIRDLDVSLFISHAFNADLDVTLTHVATGTAVVLFTDIGNDDQGLLVRLDDEAGIDIGAAANSGTGAPVAGTFNLEAAALLSAFDGIDASGQWRLTINDDTATNVGFLNGWSLHFVY
jgi:hypothetical protein